MFSKCAFKHFFTTHGATWGPLRPQDGPKMGPNLARLEDSLALGIRSKGSWEPWGLSCPQFWAKFDQIALILVINCTFFGLNSNYFCN